MGAVIVAQLYWLNKIYNFEEKEFNTSVVKSIQGVYEDLQLTKLPTVQLRQKVEHPATNTFLFKTDSLPSKELLLEYLLYNLEDFEVFSDCYVGLYTPAKQGYVYEVFLPAAGSRHYKKVQINLKVYQKSYSYVCLYFPYRSQYILYSMKWWIISAAFLLLVLVAFSFSIFYLYKQKFLNEIQNDFIQNVTHEFQTPLTTLLVGLDAIAKPSMTRQPVKFDTYVMLMKAQANYLQHHIENLMSVLKAEANGLVTEKTDVVVNDLVRKALIQLHTIIEEKNATIHLRLEQADCCIRADEASLFMAILNLLSNALKYAKDPVITIETKKYNKHYSIAIQDNGIGIDEKIKKKLFKKFYRVQAGNIHNVKGLGLGLYFVKKVVDGHHGTITVKSTPGQGSTFLIELQ
jgi:two-component system, OmpR family, phosphate regulon sensor histidine kinase PhoR